MSRIDSLTLHCICADPETEITSSNPDCFAVQTQEICGETVTLPAASVAVIELRLAD